MENAYFVPLQSRDFAQKVTQIINTKEAGVILFLYIPQKNATLIIICV